MPTTLTLPLPLRPPSFVSPRRRLDETLSDLHRLSNPNHTKQIHAQTLKHNLHVDPHVAPKLVSSYALSRNLPSAVAVLRLVPDPSTHLFNSLLRVLPDPFPLFKHMLSLSLPPDSFTFPPLLRSAHPHLASVKAVHACVVKSRVEFDIFVPNSLLDAYSRCGRDGVGEALKVFVRMGVRDVVSWNSMIAGRVRAGDVEEARRMFDEMPERDVVSWNTVIDGYAKAGDAEEAFRVFERMPVRNVVSWSTVVKGFCKKGDVEFARMLFEKMPVRNLVSWTIMVCGYAGNGFAMEADAMFDRMLGSGLRLDVAAVVSVLASCAESGLLRLGVKVHEYVVGSELKWTTRLCNALLDMYGKCGHLEEAWGVFEGMELRDRVSWNSMIQNLAVHGHGERALKLFSRMEMEGVAPDGVTFIGVLSACTHIGLVEEGRQYFFGMEKDYGVLPQVEHYGCMVDLLGRVGLLKDAFELANSMPFEPSAIIWGSLLSACRTHNNVSLAEEVVDRLIKMDTSDAGVYAIMSNIYANAGCWDGMAKMRVKMKGAGVQKPAGSSFIEVDNVVHEFTVGDQSHPRSRRILKMLRRLGKHLRQAGYVPKVQLVNS